jgi:hypothetical protein
MLAGDRNTLPLSATRFPRRNYKAQFVSLIRLVSYFAAGGYAPRGSVPAKME